MIHSTTPALTLNNGVEMPALGLGVFQSTKAERIAENLDVFDFELTADEMAALDGLDTGRRGGPQPDAVTLESFGRDIPEA